MKKVGVAASCGAGGGAEERRRRIANTKLTYFQKGENIGLI